VRGEAWRKEAEDRSLVVSTVSFKVFDVDEEE